MELTMHPNAYETDLFKLIDQHKIVVPEKYNYDTHLEEFTKRNELYFGDYNYQRLKKEFFPKSSFIPTPNSILVCHKFYIKTEKRVRGRDCVDFLENHNCQLPGVRGGMLIFEDGRGRLPVNSFNIFFEKEELLPESKEDGHWLPTIYRGDGENFSFRLSCYECGFYNGNYMYGLTELK